MNGDKELWCDELQRCRRRKVNAITIGQSPAVNSLTLVDQPVEAFGILDYPGSLLLAYPGVQS